MRNAIRIIERSAPRGRGLLLAAMLLLSLGAAPPARAGGPEVRFDAAPVVEAVDVTDARFAAASPYERLIAARVRVSTRLVAGREAELDSIEIVVRPEGGPWRVVDFAPRTQLAGDVAGPIETIEQLSDQTRLRVDLEARLISPQPWGLVDGQPAVDFEWGEGRQAQRTFQSLPPRWPVVASGTTDFGRGVFYRLSPSPQETLQGEREFTVVLAVPLDWRSGWLTVTAAAQSEERLLVGRRTVRSKPEEFRVGMYLEGDLTAQAAVLAWQRGASGVDAPERRSLGREFELHVDEALQWIDRAHEDMHALEAMLLKRR